MLRLYKTDVNKINFDFFLPRNTLIFALIENFVEIFSFFLK